MGIMGSTGSMGSMLGVGAAAIGGEEEEDEAEDEVVVVARVGWRRQRWGQRRQLTRRGLCTFLSWQTFQRRSRSHGGHAAFVSYLRG